MGVRITGKEFCVIKVKGYEVKPTIFPDKTSQVWKLPDNILLGYETDVYWDFENENEIIHFAQLVNILRSRGLKVAVHISYLPYARQDKEVNNQQTFALRTFANILNSLNLSKVYCLDVHSSIAKDIIDNLIDISPAFYIAKAAEGTKADLFCYPDNGAAKRYSNLFPNIPIEYVVADKVRNQATGVIEKLSFVPECQKKIKGKRILIVDDICDGGWTFQATATELYAHGAKSVNLYVSHGVFSKGLGPLRESKIKKIYTHKGEVK